LLGLAAIISFYLFLGSETNILYNLEKAIGGSADPPTDVIRPNGSS